MGSQTPQGHPGAGLGAPQMPAEPLPSCALGCHQVPRWPCPSRTVQPAGAGLSTSGELLSQPPPCLPNGP